MFQFENLVGCIQIQSKEDKSKQTINDNAWADPSEDFAIKVDTEKPNMSVEEAKKKLEQVLPEPGGGPQ